MRGIPLKGTLAAKMNIAGPLEQPEIYISGKSDNTGLYINNQEILFDDFFFSLKKKEKAFQLEEFLLKKADAFLTAGGMISGKELALAYRLEDLSLTDFYGSFFRDGLEGRINIEEGRSVVPCWIRLFPAAWMYGTCFIRINPWVLFRVISIIMPETLPWMVSVGKTGNRNTGLRKD